MDSKELYVVETRRNLQPKELPIDPDKANDGFYRYKTRQLIVQVVGKGKMIRTVFTNLEDVATDLRVPPDYIPNYLAKAIGATAKYDPKKPERERGNISGEYSMKELSEIHLRFIKKFVLCPKCTLPEITYSFSSSKKSALRLRCASCGWRGTLADLDLDEKFVRYVVAHPPPATTMPNEKKKDANANGDAEKVKIASPAQNGNGKKKSGDEEWAGDLSKEAVKKRMDAMVPTNLQTIVQTDLKSLPDPVVRLTKFIEENTGKTKEIIEEIDSISRIYQLDTDKLLLLITESLFPDFASLVTRVRANLPIVEHYFADNVANQEAFLSTLEKRYAASKEAESKATYLKVLPTVLQTLYNEELLDEAAVELWNKKQPAHPTAGQEVRKAAAPFITWMREAQEESEEESEEEKDEKPADKTAEKKGPPKTLDEEIDDL